MWLIPLPNGDRDVVPNKHSALLYIFFGNIIGKLGCAVCSDLFDPVPFMLFQLLGCASFSLLSGGFARSGWLKEERVLIHVYR